MSGTRPGADDEGLRRLFEELRAADGRAVPPFEAVLGAARSRAARRRARRPLRAAAALAALAAAGALIVLRPWTPRFEPVPIASWRSPTAFLLNTPGDALLRSVPSLTASVVELGSPAAPAPSVND